MKNYSRCKKKDNIQSNLLKTFGTHTIIKILISLFIYKILLLTNHLNVHNNFLRVF